MNLLASFKPLTTLIFDIDGVLTDGSILVFETGEQVRQMNVKDGYALQLAIQKKYHVAVISGGNGLGAGIRLEKLGITDVFLNIKDNLKTLESYLKNGGFTEFWWHESDAIFQISVLAFKHAANPSQRAALGLSQAP